MKLITAIVNKEDSKNVCNELLKSKFYVTRLATTGGFLMAGNMTLLICTDDERVDDCIGIISKCCKQRTEIVRIAFHKTKGDRFSRLGGTERRSVSE